jgi:hypothetical protein
MSNVVDTVVAYKFIRALSTPFKDWEAFELGLIDDNGIRLRKPKTGEEKKALPGWKNLIRNIKRFIEKLPFGKTRLGSFAAALWLIKEEMGVTDISVLENELRIYLGTKDLLITEDNCDIINTLTAGKYSHEGDILYTPEDLDAIGIVFGEAIFEVPEILTQQKRIVTWNELKRL